jgi:ribosome-associated translation inhibitor RaiA
MRLSASDRAGEDLEMRYRFHHLHEAPRAQVERHVRAKADLLDARLRTFEEELVELDVHLDHRKKRNAERRDTSYFDGHLVLYLPGRKLPNLSASGHGERWETAINEAFDDLTDQLDRLLAKLHGDTDIHAYQHRPSWEREGAELLGRPQEEASRPEDVVESQAQQ